VFRERGRFNCKRSADPFIFKGRNRTSDNVGRYKNSYMHSNYGIIL